MEVSKIAILLFIYGETMSKYKDNDKFSAIHIRLKLSSKKNQVNAISFMRFNKFHSITEAGINEWYGCYVEHPIPDHRNKFSIKIRVVLITSCASLFLIILTASGVSLIRNGANHVFTYIIIR